MCLKLVTINSFSFAFFAILSSFYGAADTWLKTNGYSFFLQKYVL